MAAREGKAFIIVSAIVLLALGFGGSVRSSNAGTHREDFEKLRSSSVSGSGGRSARVIASSPNPYHPRSGGETGIGAQTVMNHIGCFSTDIVSSSVSDSDGRSVREIESSPNSYHHP